MSTQCRLAVDGLQLFLAVVLFLDLEGDFDPADGYPDEDGNQQDHENHSDVLHVILLWVIASVGGLASPTHAGPAHAGRVSWQHREQNNQGHDNKHEHGAGHHLQPVNAVGVGTRIGLCRRQS